jgi:hypothetical protein
MGTLLSDRRPLSLGRIERAGRPRANLLIRDRRWEGAATALRQALRIAREQQAQGFELRVAASLDRLQAAKSSQPSER